MRIGAHCSAAGGLHLALERAAQMGCRSVQIFTSSPRRWQPSVHGTEAVEKWREARAAHDVGPVFSHGPYLINLAAEQRRIYQASVAALSAGLRHCEALGLEGLIFHLGSHQGRGLPAALPQVAGGLAQALEASPGASLLLLENSAGAGNAIGASLHELAAVIDSTGGHERLRVCLDSAHAFAAGFDLRRAEEVVRLVHDLRANVGLDRLAALHLNDSLTPLGSKRDRHANLGEGEIGLAGLANFLRHPAFAGLPAMLETPGFGGGGPDKCNVEIALALIEQGSATACGALRRARASHGTSAQPRGPRNSRR